MKVKTWAAAVAAWVAVASFALAQEGPKPAQIDRNGVLILIRETMLALDQANKTGNYTVLRDLGSPAFQQNNAARLGEIFASERRDNLDLSGVAVLEPQLSLLPQIEAQWAPAHDRVFSFGARADQFRRGLCSGERTVAPFRHQRGTRPFRTGRAGGAAPGGRRAGAETEVRQEARGKDGTAPAPQRDAALANAA